MSKVTLVQAQPTITAETLNQAVLTYKELKAKIKFLENELKAPKETIEAAVSNTQNGVIITEAWKISLSVFQTERFELDKAKAVLGEEALKEFIKHGVQSRLNVN